MAVTVACSTARQCWRQSFTHESACCIAAILLGLALGCDSVRLPTPTVARFDEGLAAGSEHPPEAAPRGMPRYREIDLGDRIEVDEAVLKSNGLAWEFERDLLIEHVRSDPEARKELIDEPLRRKDGQGSARALALLAMLKEPLTDQLHDAFNELAYRRWCGTVFVWSCVELKLLPREGQVVLDEVSRMVGAIGADGKFIRDALSAMLSMLQTLPLNGQPKDESMEWLARLEERLREVPVAIKKFDRRRPELAAELRWRLMRLVQAINQKSDDVHEDRAGAITIGAALEGPRDLRLSGVSMEPVGDSE
mmetsp:Transcript_93106/g.260368  ORF Transcript_93106/g.260368 Transcript_93106/m.260368 type:complete len:308 (+) Transcript_93106:1-924(+)